MAAPRSKSPPLPTPTWTGGWVSSTTYAYDPEPYRPDVVLWLHRGKVLASAVVHPEAREAALARCLREALATAKAPPSSVRVCDASVTPIVRAALGAAVPVRVVAKSPDLEAAAEPLLPPYDEDLDDSYLARGRIAPALVGQFFAAAAALFRAAPWSMVPDDSVLFAFDAPLLDIHAAAVAVVGQRGVERGVLLFESVNEYLAFQRASMSDDDDGDQGADLFAISFAEAASEARLAEVAAHGWELVAPGLGAFGVPMLDIVDRDGVRRPLTPRDLQIAVTLARTVTQMVAQHGARLAASAGPAVATRDRANATLTLPHPGAAAFDAAMAPHREVNVILRDFLASELRGRVPGVWRDAAEVIAHALLDEKFEESGARFDAWPPRLVDAAMAHVAPRIGDARALAVSGDALARFLGFMVASGRLAPAAGERLRARAAGHLDAAASALAAGATPRRDLDAPADDETVDDEVLAPGVAEWARGALKGARA